MDICLQSLVAASSAGWREQCHEEAKELLTRICDIIDVILE